jgi:hypothetical protein
MLVCPEPWVPWPCDSGHEDQRATSDRASRACCELTVVAVGDGLSSPAWAAAAATELVPGRRSRPSARARGCFQQQGEGPESVLPIGRPGHLDDRLDPELGSRGKGGNQSGYDGTSIYVIVDKHDVAVVDPATFEVTETLEPFDYARRSGTS